VEASTPKVVYLSRRLLGKGGRARGADPEEARLAAALNAREPEAIGAVSRRYGRVIGGFLREALPDSGTAEDVFQQVLVEIWKRGPQYEPARSSLLTWMMTIARSRAIDECRRRRPEPVDPSLIGDRGDPHQSEEMDELLERWRVAELLGRIPAEEATVLRLRFYEGLAQPEIAERTGIKLGTVKHRMINGLARLRELIEIEEEGR
jgi:RNA polymerase sigma-70 factor, ECF subfamily